MQRSGWLLLLAACAGTPAEEGADGGTEVAELRSELEVLTARVERLEAGQGSADGPRSLRPPGEVLTAAEPPGGDPRVEALGSNRYALSLALVAESEAPQVRLLPHRTPDGDVDGARISGVRRSSWLSAAGIKNGDLLHALDGEVVRDADAFSAFFAGLASQAAPGAVEVSLTRRGQPLELVWEWRAASRP